MFNLVPQIIFFTSLAVVAYLFLRAASRVTEEEASRSHARITLIGRLIERLPLEEIDARINAYLEKALRKTKVFLLKIDNKLTSSLERLKTTNGNGGVHMHRDSLFHEGEKKKDSLPSKKEKGTGGGAVKRT